MNTPKPNNRGPARKLGANRNEPARKEHRSRNCSESCDMHEDRGTLQSKFNHPQPAITRVQVTLPRPDRARSAPLWPDAPAPQPAFRSVTLRLVREGASVAAVAGSFNDWQPDRTALKRHAEGWWETDLTLLPGDYEYRFVVDGEWIDDPLATRHVPNPFGGENAVLHVP